MRLVVVVPAAAGCVGSLDPFGLAGGFDVAVAESHVGAAAVPIADAGAVELRDDVGKDHVEEVVGIGRRTAEVDVDKGGAVAESNHLGRDDDAIVRRAPVAVAGPEEVAAQSKVQRRGIAFRCTAMVVAIVRINMRVGGFSDVEVLVGSALELRATEYFCLGDRAQGALPVAEAVTDGGEWKEILIFDVELQCDGKLAEVAEALGLASAAFGSRQRGQEKAGDDGDDGDDDEEFGEGEGSERPEIILEIDN